MRPIGRGGHQGCGLQWTRVIEGESGQGWKPAKEVPRKGMPSQEAKIRLGKEITNYIRTEGAITMGGEIRMQMFNMQNIELMAVGGWDRTYSISFTVLVMRQCHIFSMMLLMTFSLPFPRAKTVCLLQQVNEQPSDITSLSNLQFVLCSIHTLRPLFKIPFCTKLSISCPGPLYKFPSPDLSAEGFHIWPQMTYPSAFIPPCHNPMSLVSSICSPNHLTPSPFPCFSQTIPPI